MSIYVGIAYNHLSTVLGMTCFEIRFQSPLKERSREEPRDAHCSNVLRAGRHAKGTLTEHQPKERANSTKSASFWICSQVRW